MSEAPKVLFRTLNLAEAFREFGLDREEIYAAAARGEVHAVDRAPRDRRSLRGQAEYPEWELEKLAELLGLTAGRVIELPDAETSSKLSYFHQRAA